MSNLDGLTFKLLPGTLLLRCCSARYFVAAEEEPRDPLVVHTVALGQGRISKTTSFSSFLTRNHCPTKLNGGNDMF